MRRRISNRRSSNQKKALSNERRLKLQDKKGEISSFEQELERTQGWSVFLFKHIRSKQEMGPYQLSFLQKLRKQLVSISKSLKSPSSQYIQNFKISIRQTTFSKPKALFIQLDKVMLRYFSENHEGKEKFFLRKNTREFLSQLQPFYDFYVFTERSREQAEEMTKIIDPQSKFFLQILSRENCYVTGKKKVIKDLRIIKNKNLKQMIILDTSVYSFAFNLVNGIPILPFETKDQNDEELSMLIPILKEASFCQNVQEYLHKNLNLLEICEEACEYQKK